MILAKKTFRSGKCSSFVAIHEALGCCGESKHVVRRKIGQVGVWVVLGRNLWTGHHGTHCVLVDETILATVELQLLPVHCESFAPFEEFNIFHRDPSVAKTKKARHAGPLES